MTTQTETETALFFAYGTLRQGQPLHGWLASENAKQVGLGRLRGSRLYFGRGHRGYPYLVMTEAPNDVAIGEVYEVPLNRGIISMLEMEQNAGYVIAEAVAEVGGEEVNVIVCEWRGGVDAPVPENDWCAGMEQEASWW
jgi:gamma-glutamylcyclotransferase (GGCT)/AIG2-like uncharacterized protein YtfP